MVNILQCLMKTEIFDDLSEESLSSIGKLARLISVRRGEFVFCEADVAEAFYIAISGYCRLIQHGDNGQGVIVEVFGKGDPIGLVAVLRRGKYPSSVEVLEGGQLLKFAVHDMDLVLSQYPSVTKQVLFEVHKRLCESHQRMRALCMRSLSGGLQYL